MRSALLIGAGVWAFTWGAVLGQGTPARAHVPGGVFAATVTGAVQAQPRGQAAFGTVAQNGSPATFSITLDAPGEAGEGGAFQALYIAGSVERPRGVFRATRGALEVIAASPGTVEARFRFEARGFLAAEPEAESREVTLSGWFAAEAQGLAVSSTAGDPIRLP